MLVWSPWNFDSVQMAVKYVIKFKLINKHIHACIKYIVFSDSCDIIVAESFQKDSIQSHYAKVS